jgi:hypothetical protein
VCRKGEHDGWPVVAVCFHYVFRPRSDMIPIGRARTSLPSI